MQIETIREEDKVIVQIRIDDEIRKDMQERLKQIYDTQSPIKDFSLYYPFEPDELEDWETILNWNAVSDNEQIEWSSQLIRKFHNKWDWLSLWMNKSVLCWDAELLGEFKDKIKWDMIVCSSVEWTKALHKKFEKYLTWGSFKYDYEMINQHTTHNRTMAFKAPSNNLSDSFMKLYLYAKSIDDELGIYILFDAVSQCFNYRLSK